MNDIFFTYKTTWGPTLTVSVPANALHEKVTIECRKYLGAGKIERFLSFPAGQEPSPHYRCSESL